MTGLTSSSKTTKSPMTMASTPAFSPGTNPAQDVRPMNGGIFQWSISTDTSARGNETFTTLPLTSGVAPVTAATAVGSIGVGGWFACLALAPEEVAADTAGG